MQEAAARTKDIALALIKECEVAQKPLYGSQLGTVIRPLMPAAEFKRAYGTLRQFIKMHCAGKIERVSARGGNDIYAAVGLGPYTHADLGLFKETPNDFWKAFSSPAGQGHLFVNPLSGDLFVALDENAHPADFVLIQKISDDEQRQYMREFADTIHDVENKSFMEALENEHYWKAWKNALKTAGDSYSKAWETFRAAKISEIFHSRLKALEVPEALHSHCLTLLKAAAERKQPSYQPIDTDAVLRSLIEHAARNMPTDRLREIELPVGFVIEFLAKNLR